MLIVNLSAWPAEARHETEAQYGVDVGEPNRSPGIVDTVIVWVRPCVTFLEREHPLAGGIVALHTLYAPFAKK